MIGFSVMMWFVSLILCIVSISLLRGNTSSMHGKVYETTTDRTGYAKASGKVVLFMSICILGSGIAALLGSTMQGIRNAVIILVIMIAVAAYSFVQIQKKYGNE